jgi:hypothetical protein
MTLTSSNCIKYSEGSYYLPFFLPDDIGSIELFNKKIRGLTIPKWLERFDIQEEDH